LLQSRRDDLESLGYILVHILTGSLPWLSKKMSKIDPRDMNQTIKMKKENMRTSCLPSPIKEFIDYSRNLQYDEAPDYETWLSAFERPFEAASTSVSKFSPEWMKYLSY
jgi:hypothetical protein